MEESSHQQRKITHYRAMILAAVVLALTTLSFQGGLDDFAKERVAETTEESMWIYGMSRSINAGISMLQSSQIKAPLVASIQVGELLDPVDDAVERLSSAMVWAIGSLFLQRIVLEVATTSVFKWSFFAAGLMALLALLFVDWERIRNPFCEVFAVSKASLDRCRDLLVRIFIVATISRFIVPTFVAISSLVSQTFLETEINKHTKNLSAWEKDVSEVQKILNEQNTQEQSHDEQSMPESVLPDGKEAQEQDLSFLGYIKDSISWIFSQSAKATSQAFSKMGDTTTQIWDKIARFASISGIVEKANDMVTSMTELLVVIVVENIILPIVFLMIAVKCSVPIAKYSVRLSSALKQDSRELRDSLQQTV